MYVPTAVQLAEPMRYTVHVAGHDVSNFVKDRDLRFGGCAHDGVLKLSIWGVTIPILGIGISIYVYTYTY